MTFTLSFSERHVSGNCRPRKLQMEETEADDTDSFSTSVKVKAKQILSRAKVSFISRSNHSVALMQVCCSHVILFAVGLLHVTWPWRGDHQRFFGACNANGFLKNNRV